MADTIADSHTHPHADIVHMTLEKSKQIKGMGLVWFENAAIVLEHMTLKSSMDAATASIICALYEIYHNTQAEVSYPKRISNCSNCAHATNAKERARMDKGYCCLFFIHLWFSLVFQYCYPVSFRLCFEIEWKRRKAEIRKPTAIPFDVVVATVINDLNNKSIVICECRASKWMRTQAIEVSETLHWKVRDRILLNKSNIYLMHHACKL